MMEHPPIAPGEPPHRLSQPRAQHAFPRQAAITLVRRLPSYARLALALSRDERIPAGRRAALMGAAAYLISPIDVVPGIIPLIGQLDDLLVVIVALRVALRSLSPQQRLEVLADAGLREDDLGADLATLGAIGEWLVVGGLRAGRAITRAGVRAARGLTRAGSRLGRGAARRVEVRLREGRSVSSS